MTPFHYLHLGLGGWNVSMMAEAQGTILNREVEDCGENDRTSREMFPGSLIINECHANPILFLSRLTSYERGIHSYLV